MIDFESSRLPGKLGAIETATKELGFNLGSDRQTGALLRTLAATKPGGRFLELGTGTGLGTAWILSGMDAAATLSTVDIEDDVVSVARRHLGDDPRVIFHLEDGSRFIEAQAERSFDFILQILGRGSLIIWLRHWHCSNPADCTSWTICYPNLRGLRVTIKKSSSSKRGLKPRTHCRLAGWTGLPVSSSQQREVSDN